MSLLLPQYTCRKGSCISWLKEVWWKVHRNCHSLECFVHQCTSLADVSLFYDMTLNTRGAMTKWGFFSVSLLCSVSQSLLLNTHVQPLSCHPLVLYAVLTPTLPLKIRPGGSSTHFFSHPTNASQPTVHIPLLNSRTTGHRALQRRPSELNN